MRGMNSQELIRRMMELTGMNATQFSKATGMTESMISRTLAGKNDPSFNKIADAIEHLGFAISFTPISQSALEETTLRLLRERQHSDDSAASGTAAADSASQATADSR